MRKNDFVYKCTSCGGEVKRKRSKAACSKCSKNWPVERGAIIFESIDYWGEMPPQQLIDLSKSAEERGWRNAVEELYRPDDRQMYISIADLNRSSWTSLLPVPYESTVLDIGSGLGAITHGLAYSYSKVISMEAIPERVRFSSIRREQEGLDNVETIQSTVRNMPFFDESFDLVVMNGILEWVGEWDTSAAPGQIQLQVLKKINKLLRPGGMVFIGIENRIGYNLFFGGMDHSGIAYTSLMPRKAASIYLKLKSPRHHRNKDMKKTEYRTYTYSKTGYRRLLAGADFGSISFYYPVPGYNQPHIIIPHDSKRLMKDYQTGAFNSSIRKRGHNVVRRVKEVLIKTGVINSMISDFLITGRKAPTAPGGALPPDDSTIGVVLKQTSKALESRDMTGVKCKLYTRPFINKQVVTVFDADGREGLAVAKISNERKDHPEYASEEFEKLRRLHELFAGDERLLRSIPRPLFITRHRNDIIAAETAVAGETLHDRINGKGYFDDRDKVARDFDKSTDWLLALYDSWEKTDRSGFPPLDKDLYSLPGDLRGVSGRTRIPRDKALLQHGDFFTKNLFFDDGRVSVIDWEHAAIGYPPLFDLFCLAASFEFLLERGRDDSSMQLATFRDTFFSKNWFSELVLENMLKMSDALGVKRSDLPSCFLAYLLVRHNSFTMETDKRDYSLAAHFRALLDYYVDNQEDFIGAGLG